MGWWQVDADTLANSRFVVSPLAEATAALKVLHRASGAHPGERAWLDTHLPAYRALLADDPVTALLVRAALGRTWNADYLTPTPRGLDDEPPFAEEVARVRGVPPGAARADLTVSLGGPLPPALCRDDLPERTARVLEWVWHETVRPTWRRRRRIVEADVVARTVRLGRSGWAAALDGMRPHLRWLGGSRLQINAYAYPPREISGTRLLFVPVTPSTGWVSWEEPADAPHRSAVVYPCAGALSAEAGSVPAPRALGTLLGGGRAAVLVLLDTPLSTTQLVALTGQGLGSVGRHLRVLREARLVRRRRAGRSVLYDRTEAGEALVAAQRDGEA
ncbi:winged helix-turn-helix domain-containing protein [Streptomyces albiaxialis]|uniref:Winged helix-turn-helix domain-containing protein n=1 Tax=Streptomyces albiaxialis TaxID=329523 RepID=A0ABN2W9K3_9ACTN